MHYFKLILLSISILLASSAFSEITTETISNNRLRVMYTEEDTSKYTEILPGLEKAKVPTRCFTQEIQNDFGQKTKQDVCTVLYTINHHIKNPQSYTHHKY